MLVANHINKNFIPPKINQTVGYAMDLVTEFQLTHVPIFEGLNFIGNIPREILEENDAECLLSQLVEFAESFYISENNSIFDAVHKYNEHITNILVVLNEKNHYVGLLMMEDVVSGVSAMPIIAEPGSVMTLSVPQKQFSFSEISKIVESNNAKIIAIVITAYKDEKVYFTVKLVSDNLSSIGETFERFGYIVVHKFYKDEREDMVKERFDLLMKYLDI